MRPAIRKILILGGIFLVTLGGFLFFSTGSESDETPYALLEEERLPFVAFDVEGETVNLLPGYVEEMNEGTLLDCVTPLPADRNLPVVIKTQGSALTAVAYEIRRTGDRGLIEQGSLSGWDADGETVRASIPVKDLIDKGTEYELIVKLTTEHHPSVSYYSRILWDEDLKTEKMMDYVTDFHTATFSASAAEKYAINWEVDNTVDNDSLAYVNIHSNFRQLTYRDLKPRETGAPEICILEMDRLFGSFLVRSTLTAASEDGTEQTYRVEEFFCLQWSDQRNAQNTTPFYLMAYERRMAQDFSAGQESLSGRGIHFGIVGAQDVAVTPSANKNWYAFTQGGALWLFDKAEAEYTELFTLHTDGEARYNDDYRIKVLETADSGDVTFLAYGYMNRGPHEGMTGVSVYQYRRETNDLTELKFIRSENGAGQVQQEIETLAARHGSRLYFLLDNTVFVLTDNGGELLRMVESAARHSLRVNDAQTAIAWTQGGSALQAESVQLMYLESGRTQTISARDGDYLQAHGFIDTDFVVTAGRPQDIRPSGLERTYPCYALVINTQDGTEAARYQYDGIYITGVSVGQGQVVIERAQSAGGALTPMEDDVLLQNAGVQKADGVSLKFEKQEIRLKTGLLVLDGLEKDVKAGRSLPKGISYYAGEERAALEDSAPARYYAWAQGTLQGIYDEAGPAIAAVYEGMGSVSDETGTRIWHRTAKEPARMTISIPAAAGGDEAGTLTGLLDTVFRLEGAEANAAALAAEGLSAGEMLAEGLNRRTVSLEGCLVKQLYLFLAKGTPVLALNGDGAPVLIIGYDASNILLYNPSGGAAVRVGAEVAQKEFEKSGSVFLTYLK